MRVSLLQPGGRVDLLGLIGITDRRFSRMVERDLNRGFRVADIDEQDGMTVVYLFDGRDGVNSMAKVYRYDSYSREIKKAIVTRWEFDVLRRMFESV